MGIRQSDFAGSWYPGGEAECREVIGDFSKSSVQCPSAGEGMLGGIVPHAGWYYSGQIAFNVIKCLKEESAPDLFVIFGRHLHPGSGNFIMTEGTWATPLGSLEIAGDLAERLVSEFNFTVETSTSYGQDNTIELQLPFIKYFFPDVKILPVGVPPAVASIRIGERVVEIADSMGQRIRVLGSTDLTHYGYNYGYTPKGTGQEAIDWVKNENDRKMVDLMLDMNSEGIITESTMNANACCSGAVAAAVAAMKKMGARKGEKLIYSTSYDVRPDSSFVGYVGIVYHK
ncbi:AmmeMemoRadiSam system protein B [Deltaproteobacteria bacterium]|nr:AmmeMemoRadiSam system protein B [Deltaproteobacteria bacterium]